MQALIGMTAFANTCVQGGRMNTRNGYRSALLLGLWVALPLFANEDAQPVVKAVDKESFQKVAAWVREQMESGGRYAHVTAAERKTVDTTLDDMGKVFEKKSTVSQMDDGERTRLYNDQEQVNAALAKRDGQRLICRSELPVGSHIPVKTCHTAEQREARTRNDVDQKRLWDLQSPSPRAQ